MNMPDSGGVGYQLLPDFVEVLQQGDNVRGAGYRLE